MTVDFELDGQPFTTLNGGPEFKFNEAISLQVDCASQKELDHYRDPAKAGRAIEAMLNMVKIDIDALERAYARK